MIWPNGVQNGGLLKQTEPGRIFIWYRNVPINAEISPIQNHIEYSWVHCVRKLCGPQNKQSAFSSIRLPSPTMHLSIQNEAILDHNEAKFGHCSAMFVLGAVLHFRPNNWEWWLSRMRARSRRVLWVFTVLLFWVCDKAQTIMKSTGLFGRSQYVEKDTLLRM